MKTKEEEKIEEAEIVEERTTGIIPIETVRTAEKKKLPYRYLIIAEMASRGWSPEEIAKEVGRKTITIYNILKRDDVWEYIAETIRSTFSEGDRILAYLYKKSLKGLDDDLSSPDSDVRKNAREQVFKQWGYGRDKLVSDGDSSSRQISLFQQIFLGRESGGGHIIESMDDIILKKRKERGLSEYGDENES